MGVTKRMNKDAWLQRALLRDHHEQQRIASDVKWHPECQVCRTLVNLQVKTIVDHVELHQEMTGRQGHLVKISDVPGTDNETTRMGIVLDGLDDLLELINVPLSVLSRALVQSILRPFTPLIAINRPQLSLRIRPGIP